MKKIWSWIILFIVFALTAIFFTQNQKYFEILKNMKPAYLLILIFITFLVTIFNGLQIKFITKMYGKNLKPKEWYGLGVVNMMVNYITPFRGGTPVKAIYLKKVHGMPYTTGIATFGAIMILGLFIYSLLGILVSIIYDLGWIITSILGFVFLMMIFIIFLFPNLTLTKYQKINYFLMSINELRTLRKKSKFVIILTAINIGLLILNAFRIYYSFQTINYHMPFSFCFVISIFTIFSLIISITPANLGVRESIFTILSKAFGRSGKIGLSASIVERAAEIVFVFAVGPIFSYILSQQKSTKKE